MDINKLLEIIEDSNFPKDVESVMRSKIVNWYNEARCEQMQLEKEKAAFEARCYAYEQIISNSNFAPIVEKAKIGFCCDAESHCREVSIIHNSAL